ncbi:helix-turn-helix domain-containing protein [Enterococcus sp. LJL99]
MNIDLIASGHRIKSIRKQHSYTMMGFAGLLGISSASTINNWEKGNNLPKPERLEKIALLGNTTVEWIKYGEFKEYVIQLLKTVDQKKSLDENELLALITALDEKQLTYKNDLKILKCAKKMYPNFFKNSYSTHLPQNSAMLFEEFLEYTIEQNNYYRTIILPQIQQLLNNSKNKKENEKILVYLFSCLEIVDNKNQAKEFLKLLKKTLNLLKNLIS